MGKTKTNKMKHELAISYLEVKKYHEERVLGLLAEWKEKNHGAIAVKKDTIKTLKISIEILKEDQAKQNHERAVKDFNNSLLESFKPKQR